MMCIFQAKLLINRISSCAGTRHQRCFLYFPQLLEGEEEETVMFCLMPNSIARADLEPPENIALHLQGMWLYRLRYQNTNLKLHN
jgi:hypothetical protein